MFRLIPAVLFAAGAAAAVAAPPVGAPPTSEPPPSATPAPPGPLAPSSRALAGKYLIAGGERDGKPLSRTAFDGWSVTVGPTTITGTDRDGREFLSTRYDLTAATARTTWGVRFKSDRPSAGGEAVGLMELAGETLTVIYNMPGGAAPTKFRTVPGQMMLILTKPTDDTKSGPAKAGP